MAMENTSGLSEGLTDAERAYFSSGGEDTSALEQQIASETNGTAPPAASDGAAAPRAPGAQGEPAAAPGAADDVDEDGAITIGADGKARDTLSGKYVPHHALHKERERRKASEGELMSVREKFTRAEERLAGLMELVGPGDGAKAAAPGATAPGAAKQAEADPLSEEPIDPEVDVFGALKQAQRQNAALLKRMQEGDQATKQKEASASAGNAYVSDAMAFAKTQPDFGNAYNHLIAQMHQEFEALGMDDAAERNRMIAQREKEFVSEVLGRKGSPAAAIYKLAKARGYKGAAPGGDPAPAAAAPAAAPKPAADPGAVAKLEAINKAKETVVSLGGSGGSAGGDVLTMESLANMSEADFNATAKRIGKAGMARIMGG